jgi:hypothetical protein
MPEEFTNKIPPKSEWEKLSIVQLYDVKSQMADTYYNMRRINASFAPQYLRFISEIDSLIKKREAAEQAEKENRD